MSIKIMIKRRFKEPVSAETLEIIDEIRMKALKDKGYIGGETLVNCDDSKEVLVISSWSSLEEWEAWYEKKEWEELEKKLLPHLDGEVNVTAFMPRADYLKKS